MKAFLAISLLIFSIFSSKSVSAQEIEWQNAIGGSTNDQLWSLKATPDGGFICGGLSDSPLSGDKSEGSYGQQDYWVVKFDSIGNISWQNDFGGQLQDYFTFIDLTSDGGYICGGASTSMISGEKTVAPKGGWDYWIVKLDSGGAIQWQKVFGGSGDDNLECIRPTSDGGYICGGYSQSDSSFDKSENSLGTADYWIVKLDSVGNLEWENTIGGAAPDFCFSIEQTQDGGYVCGGTSGSDISVDKSENSIGVYDYWILKLSPIGVIELQNTIGGSSQDQLNELRQTDDNGFILAGLSISPISGDKKEDSQGSADCWIVKVDSSLIIQWENAIGGSGSDQAYSIQQTSDGGYISGGYSESSVSGDKNQNSFGDKDYWILKLDGNGHLLWQNTSGGSDRDEIRSVCEDNQGQFICGGWTWSGQTGNKTEPSQGGLDYWILKIKNRYNIITGIQYFDSNNNGIQDFGELGIPGKKIVETTTGNFVVSDQNGFYSLVVNDTGTFEVNPIVNAAYFNTLPVNHTATFNTLFNTDSLNDFALQATANFIDLCVSISPLTPFRSGMNASYLVNYFNYGNTTQSPTIIFYPDQYVDFLSSIPSANSITQDSVVFSIGPLVPFQSGQIVITVNVDAGLPIGTVINSGTSILPVINDVNPECNSMYWEVLTTGSYDPNDILVSKSTLYDYETVTPQFLEYIIRFQNTGNDTAFYVSVDNKIENQLDIGSFDLINASHPCQMEYQSMDSTLKFVFNNILLPDSNIKEPLSHGFIRYRIKPVSNLIAGDSLLNNATITFDYNAPVLTNTTVTEIILPSAVADALENSFELYPNPFSSEMTIEQRGGDQSNVLIELSNIYGQKVLNLYNGSIESANWRRKFDLSSLAKGIYILTIKGKQTTSQKLVKL